MEPWIVFDFKVLYLLHNIYQFFIVYSKKKNHLKVPIIQSLMNNNWYAQCQNDEVKLVLFFNPAPPIAFIKHHF